MNYWRKTTGVSLILIIIGFAFGYLVGYTQVKEEVGYLTREQDKLKSQIQDLEAKIAEMRAARLGRVAVTYYGWLIVNASGAPSESAYRIAAKGPSFLIAALHTEEPMYVNLSPQVLSLVKGAGTRVLASFFTNYGDRPLDLVKGEIAEAISLGVDGVFIDQAYNFGDNSKLWYYSEIYNFVKSYGSDKLVVINTGVWQTGEAAMSVTDILSVEYEWFDFATKNPWRCKYLSTRFLGLSEGVTNSDDAAKLTKQAWELGILNHYSTSTYIELEPWWEEYAARLGY